ncbi:MAG: hypothetical protein HKP30_06905, partial [Myxococcales bacterium]|nr:hypothetical protein [Myxococcales bacterium]
MSASATSPGATPVAAPAPSPWLFGRTVDVLLGYGLAYVLSIPLIVALVGSDRLGDGPVWGGAALALVFSTPHYGATLMRVYARPQDRQRYALFTVWITLGLLALFGAGLFSPIVGSLLLTAYVTWSPWHFSGQNYGLSVMYLRRRRIAFDDATKRDLYVSYVLSAILAILAIHLAGSQLVFANGASDDSGIFGVVQLGLPLPLARALTAGLGLAYLFFLLRVARALLRESPAGALVPVLLLVGTQALWFAVPGLAATLVARDLPASLALPLSAVWISTAHAIQYLWVTAYYTKHTGEAPRTSRFLFRSLVAGAFLSLPIFLFLPNLGGRFVPNAAGVAVLVFSVVNLHHFILDGAIWKLRDGKVARALLRSGADDAPVGGGGRRWLAGSIAAIGLACVLAQGYALWLSHLAGAPDTPYPILRAATHDLARVGQASPELWARLGKRAEAEGQTDVAIRSYRRAVRDMSQPPAWVADRLAWLLIGERADEPRSVAQAQRLADYVTRALGPDRAEGYQTLAAAHAPTHPPQPVP